MGNSSSSNNNHEIDYNSCDTLGYRILGASDSENAKKFVIYFDFIIGAQGYYLFPVLEINKAKLNSTENQTVFDEFNEIQSVSLQSLVQESLSKNTDIELLIFNVKNQSLRTVVVVADKDTHQLGISIKLDSYYQAEEHVLRVLDVTPGGPAYNAGIQAEHDYLLGTKDTALPDQKVLFNILSSTSLEEKKDPVQLYVYNAQTDSVRICPVIMSSSNNNGLLGAKVGTGYLHAMPLSCRKTIGQSIIMGEDDSIAAGIVVGANGSETDTSTTCISNSGNGSPTQQQKQPKELSSNQQPVLQTLEPPPIYSSPPSGANTAVSATKKKYNYTLSDPPPISATGNDKQ